ncbi:MAG: DUF5694 domain-containing protein [Pseudomonadota bacterium]
MRIRTSLLAMLALSACATAPANEAAAPDSIAVMVIGTWHFGGSDSDVISVEADNVLTPRRQRELEEAALRLAAFKPTVVITERVTAAPDYVDPKYADFTPAALAANEDERVQLAYRLASKAGVARVYGLDEQPVDGEPDYFPFGKVMEHAAASGQQAEIDGLIGKAQEMAAEETKRIGALTMSEALIAANTGKLSSPQLYYELLKLDTGESQPGAELNGYWFMRNAKIFSKLIDVTKPGDRVVIVFGAGHKFWLDHLAEQTPGFQKVDPAPYLRAARD